MAALDRDRYNELSLIVKECNLSQMFRDAPEIPVLLYRRKSEWISESFEASWGNVLDSCAGPRRMPSCWLSKCFLF